jgi:predicted MPP superfamily phosphohydrolase
MAGAKLSRRAALGIPITAGAAAATGFAQGSALAELKPLSLLRPDLPSDLAGLTILQLSDLHLGTGLDQPHLERLVETLWPLRPDLVVLTGDVADRSEALAGALPAIESLRPRFGTYAVLGNHEYLSGELEAMLEIYRASGVRLLVNETELVRVGRARLAIVGIDDPFGKESGFFERALAGCDPGPCAADFRLLLSHRPEAFTLAARRGIDLTLSGHTHGGQIGWWGRSAVELVGLARYMWGWYRSGASTLYTSAGAGDWFPFRVGCPREAPLIVLRAGRNRG